MNRKVPFENNDTQSGKRNSFHLMCHHFQCINTSFIYNHPRNRSCRKGKPYLPGGSFTKRAIPAASLVMNSEQSPTLPHLKSCIKSLCNHIPSDLNTLLLKYSVSLDCIWNTRYCIWNVNLLSCVSIRPNTIIISIQTIITPNMVIIISSFVTDRDFTVDFSANNEYSNWSR